MLDGVAAAIDLAPDIVLVDVNLPDIDGFEVAERLAGDKRTARRAHLDPFRARLRQPQ